jgi:hypothetical protein
MRTFLLLIVMSLAVPVAAGAQRAGAVAGPTLTIETPKGTIEIRLFSQDAPKTVAKVVDLVKRNFYRGQRIHSDNIHGTVNNGSR